MLLSCTLPFLFSRSSFVLSEPFPLYHVSHSLRDLLSVKSLGHISPEAKDLVSSFLSFTFSLNPIHQQILWLYFKIHPESNLFSSPLMLPHWSKPSSSLAHGLLQQSSLLLPWSSTVYSQQSSQMTLSKLKSNHISSLTECPNSSHFSHRKKRREGIYKTLHDLTDFVSYSSHLLLLIALSPPRLLCCFSNTLGMLPPQGLCLLFPLSVTIFP